METAEAGEENEKVFMLKVNYFNFFIRLMVFFSTQEFLLLFLIFLCRK